MDKTVPAGAAILLDFIRETEVGTVDRSGYDVIYGHNQDQLKKPVTRMTIAEIQKAQGGWSKRFGSSATAGYQFMKTTLAGLVKELALDTSAVFTADLQDRLGFHLLKRRGYDEFMTGKISRTEFGKRLAQEWASFPVLANCKGGKRQVKRGQSYYAGDGLNKSLVSPQKVEAVLDRVKATVSEPVAAPEPAPVPPRTEPNEFDAILRRGSRGPFVAELQTNLNKLGHGPVMVDGHFGAETETAVVKFQHDNGLKPDGWAGPRTIEAIGQAVKNAELQPIIEEAEKTVPPTAETEVKTKANWWTGITGGLTGAGAFITALTGMDWKVVAAIGVTGLGALLVVILMRQHIIAAFKEINAGAQR